MRRIVLIGASAALLAAAGAAAKGPPPLDAVVWKRTVPHLVRLDPVTLRELPAAKPVRLAVGAYGHAVSPDRRLAALAGGKPELELVSLRERRSLGVVRLGSDGWLQLLGWSGGRVLVVVSRAESRLAVVDPSRLRVVRSVPLDGRVYAGTATRSGLVLVVGAGETMGPARLVVAGPDGRPRSAPLRRITVGTIFAENVQQGPVVGEQRIPGVAVDEAGNRAFVVGGEDEPLAEVDLRTLEVVYRRPARTTQARRKALTGPVRRALWLGDGLLAVTGYDLRGTATPGAETQEQLPVGLRLVDTRQWTSRLVAEGAADAAVASGKLLAFGVAWGTDRGTTGIGLVGLELNGRERFRALAGGAVFEVLTANGIAYASHGGRGRRVAVVWLADGRVMRDVSLPRQTRILLP